MANTISSVKAVINGQTINLTYNSSSGKYEASGVAPTASSYNLTGGYYPVSVTATYTTGESTTVNDQTAGSVGTGCRLVVKERVAPTINITYPTAGQFITATDAQRIELQLRDNATQTSGYSGISLSSFSLVIGGSTLHSTDFTVTAVTGGYNLSFIPSTPLPDGAYTITATVSDNDGNTSGDVTRSFVIDTAPPQLSVDSPEDNLATSNITVTVSGTTTDTAGQPVTVKIYLDDAEQGTASVSSTGTFSYELDLAEEGDHTVRITATDTSGKTSSVTRNVFFSTAVPEITSVTLIPNPADGGATYTIRVEVS